ncbi:MAG: glycosyltransferase, partial [Pseudomonadota bacterium]
VLRKLLVGEGELHDTIQARIDAAELGHRIVMAGSRSDIPDVLAAFDIFVLSSDREGHPLTALEAQAAGTPVVLTNAGGSRDALAVEGELAGGVIVEKSAAALAEAVTAMAQDAAARDTLSRVAQRVALSQFDLDAMVDHYERCFLSE